LKKISKDTIIIIIICIIGLFAFLIGTIAVPNFIMARNLAEVDMSRAIFGAWRGETKEPNSGAVKTLTFYPKGRFESDETVYFRSGEVINITYSGTYKIDGNKIIYVISATNKPDKAPVGAVIADTIIKLTNSRFVYRGKARKRQYLDRITFSPK